MNPNHDKPSAPAAATPTPAPAGDGLLNLEDDTPLTPAGPVCAMEEGCESCQ